LNLRSQNTSVKKRRLRGQTGHFKAAAGHPNNIAGLHVLPVDHSSSLPANVQIEEDLRRLIHSELAGKDVRLPPETVLAEMYDVSRMTLRQALRRLADAGLVRRRPGGGTVVTATPSTVSCDLGLMLSMTRQLQLAGYRTRSALHESSVEVPSAVVANALKLGPNARALSVRRIISIDNQPIAMNRSWLPQRLVPGLEMLDLEEGSLWSTIAKRYGLNPDHARNVLEIVPATSYEAQQLQTATSDTLVRLTSLIFDRKNRPIEYSVVLWTSKNLRFHFSSTQRAERTGPRMGGPVPEVE
jgi:GntR family transcriptional regulator